MFTGKSVDDFQYFSNYVLISTTDFEHET